MAPYDSEQRYFEDDDDTPDCFGDFQPGTACDFCPFAEECQ